MEIAHFTLNYHGSITLVIMATITSDDSGPFRKLHSFTPYLDTGQVTCESEFLFIPPNKIRYHGSLMLTIAAFHARYSRLFKRHSLTVCLPARLMPSYSRIISARPETLWTRRRRREENPGDATLVNYIVVNYAMERPHHNPHFTTVGL